MKSGPQPPADGLFASRPPERPSFDPILWAIAGVVVLVLVAGLVIRGSRKSAGQPNAQLPLDAYAPSITISNLEMSESTSLSGGKSTYIDGHVRNAGPKTVTGATVQVFFANDESQAPQVETLPLTPIRTRQPYIDTQPLADAPLAPGAEREFRLIFEDIRSSWNQQLPAIHVVHVATR